MKRIFITLTVLAVLGTTLAFSRFQEPPAEELSISLESRNPWTHLNLNNKSENFQFVIVSDRTGGHRPRIFSTAVKQINLLQPEFVLSVGDLIEGYTKDEKRISEEWKEFQTYTSELKMPFFYIPGNHDYTNDVMAKEWKNRFGRHYFHFVYKDVLFLLLNSEDPPGKGGHLDKEQVEYAKNVLNKYKDVRWTVVALHKPLWSYDNLQTNGWLGIESALGTRPYTVFAGHRHQYVKFERNGRNYYQLATTGGGSRMRGAKYGEFDHVVWVTMTNEGPVLANILLDGIYPEDLKMPITKEKGYPYDIRPTYAVAGSVYYRGVPCPNAQVVFHLLDEKTKKTIRAAEAFVEPDGTYQLTTYKLNDGAPLGKYAVTITWRDPLYDTSGKITHNKLPEMYSDIATSGLRAEVTDGVNRFNFDLSDPPKTKK